MNGLCGLSIIAIQFPSATTQNEICTTTTVYILIETFDDTNSPQICADDLQPYTGLFAGNVLMVCGRV
jgi:hypothetical protein